jgi:hypothetical protein
VGGFFEHENTWRSNLHLSSFSALLSQTLNPHLKAIMTSPMPPTELQSLIRQLKASTTANQNLLATLQSELQSNKLRPELWKQAIETHRTHMETTIAVIMPLLALAQTQGHQQLVQEANDVLSSAIADRDQAKWHIAKMTQEQIKAQREEERHRNRRVKTPKSIRKKMAPKAENQGGGEEQSEQVAEEKEEGEEFFDAPETSDASRESATPTPTPENPATPTKQKRRIDMDNPVGSVRQKRIKSVSETPSAKRKRSSDLGIEDTSKRWKESLAQYERRYLSDEEWRSGIWNEIDAGG